MKQGTKRKSRVKYLGDGLNLLHDAGNEVLRLLSRTRAGCSFLLENQLPMPGRLAIKECPELHLSLLAYLKWKNDIALFLGENHLNPTIAYTNDDFPEFANDVDAWIGKILDRWDLRKTIKKIESETLKRMDYISEMQKEIEASKTVKRQIKGRTVLYWNREDGTISRSSAPSINEPVCCFKPHSRRYKLIDYLRQRQQKTTIDLITMQLTGSETSKMKQAIRKDIAAINLSIKKKDLLPKDQKLINGDRPGAGYRINQKVVICVVK